MKTLVNKDKIVSIEIYNTRKTQFENEEPVFFKKYVKRFMWIPIKTINNKIIFKCSGDLYNIKIIIEPENLKDKEYFLKNEVVYKYPFIKIRTDSDYFIKMFKSDKELSDYIKEMDLQNFVKV